ncbi:MAG: hypothetical protein ACE5KP_04985, partial [Dehalococcoidales bacterium]
MTDEELNRALKEVSHGINKLSNLDRPLTREEERDRSRLSRRKYVLDRIKEAREKNRKDDEVFNSTVYEMLVSWGERHPIWMGIFTQLLRVRWGSGLTAASIRDSANPK